MIRKHLALTLFILSACAEKKSDSPTPTPALTSAKEELKAAETANTAKTQEALQAAQELAQDKAETTKEVAKLKSELADELKDKKPDVKVVQELKTDIEQKKEEIAALDQKEAEKQKEIAALEQERAEIEAKKAELAQEEKEAEKIAVNEDESNWPKPIMIMHQALTDIKKALPSQKEMLSAPVIFPELKGQSLRHLYTRALKQDADTMVLVSLQKGGLQIVKIKATATTGTDSDQTVTHLPLGLETDSIEQSRLRAARVTSTKGLDVLFLDYKNGYKLELVRLDASLKLIERRAVDSSQYDYNLGISAMFLDDNTLVWGNKSKIGRVDLATKTPTSFCGIRSARDGITPLGQGADQIHFHETDKGGEYLVVFVDDTVSSHARQAVTVSFVAPFKDSAGLCGIQVQDETWAKSFGFSDISARNEYTYFSGDFRGGRVGFGNIYSTYISPDEEFKKSERIYHRAFVSADNVMAISAMKDETQIDIIGGLKLEPLQSFKHSSQISDALPIEANGSRVLVTDKEGMFLLIDTARVKGNSEEAVLDSREVLEKNKSTALSKLRFGEKGDIVPFFIGVGFSDEDFNRVGFIKVSK